MPAKKHPSFLEFSRKDRRGTLALFSVVILCCMSPFFVAVIFPGDVLEEKQPNEPLQQLLTKQAKQKQERKTRNEENFQPYYYPQRQPYTKYASGKQFTLFNFDPNTIDEAGWAKLGLREKTIATIMNFRARGGKFREPDDLRKIWGLFPDEADRLVPYVSIENVNASEITKPNFSAPASAKRFIESLEINSADSTALESLPGIGAKLSQRIINFRQKLGGFYSVDQVAETFGLADSVFQIIKPRLQISGELRKVNINTATIDELKVHPYVRYHLANAIVQYRTQHGNFTSAADLRNIMIMDEKQLQKLAPYLQFE